MVLLEKAETQQSLVLLRKENENVKQQAQVKKNVCFEKWHTAHTAAYYSKYYFILQKYL